MGWRFRRRNGDPGFAARGHPVDRQRAGSGIDADIILAARLDAVADRAATRRGYGHAGADALVRVAVGSGHFAGRNGLRFLWHELHDHIDCGIGVVVGADDHGQRDGVACRAAGQRGGHVTVYVHAEIRDLNTAGQNRGPWFIGQNPRILGHFARHGLGNRGQRIRLLEFNGRDDLRSGFSDGKSCSVFHRQAVVLRVISSQLRGCGGVFSRDGLRAGHGDLAGIALAQAGGRGGGRLRAAVIGKRSG